MYILALVGEVYFSFRSLGPIDPKDIMHNVYVYIIVEKEMAAHSSISCLKDTMDRGAWQATVHGVTKSWT